MMSITVILCTYNRCESLATALNSAAALQLPCSVEWEVLVVDNNSSDQTRDLVEEFCRRYSDRFRYLFEPQQGLSHARNAGIRGARGDIIAFMDDDVTVEPTWLQNLTATLHDGHWAGAGGRIVPAWNCLPPRWLPLGDRYGLAPLAIFDLGTEPGQLAEAPFGANMAFRRAMFEKYGLFRTDLGRCASTMISNEDTEFGGRLLDGGERLIYEPSAIVYHPVPENRVQKKYFLAWSFGKGRADIRQFGARRDTRYQCWGIPLYMFRNLVVRTLRWMVAVEPGLRFSRKLKVWAKAGEIFECYRQSRESKITMRMQGPLRADVVLKAKEQVELRIEEETSARTRP
jgi:glucosyl-dolichyl phosphate glucuronosyltransferase